MNNHDFCRAILRDVMEEVKKEFDPHEIKAAWVWSDGRDNFEFHGPRGFYCHNLRMTDCLWSAKANGWQKQLDAIKERETG